MIIVFKGNGQGGGRRKVGKNLVMKGEGPVSTIAGQVVEYIGYNAELVMDGEMAVADNA